MNRDSHKQLFSAAKLVVALFIAACVVITITTTNRPNANAVPLNADLVRAKTIHPRKEFMGTNRANMVDVLNNHLKTDSNLQTKECSEFTKDELNQLGAAMWSMMDSQLNQVYEIADDARQLRHSTLSGMRSAWDSENEMESIRPGVDGTLVGKKCREMVMWYVHHLPEDKKERFKQQRLVLPLLPQEDMEKVQDDNSMMENILSKNPHMRQAVVGVNADASQGCVKCHVQQAKGRKSHQKSIKRLGVNTRIIYNPEPLCRKNAIDSFMRVALAVTLADEMLYGYKVLSEVEPAFEQAFAFPVKLFAEDVGRDGHKNYFGGRKSGYNMRGLIGYYTKHGKERRGYHDPVFSYISKCSNKKIVYHYKELVEDHVGKKSKWSCVVFTTVEAIKVGNVFKVKTKMSKVGFL